MIAHYVNGAFEVCGALFILLSVFKLARDKRVSGISWVHVSFFTFWGMWNLAYYPAVGDWISFFGGVAILSANTLYVGQLIYFTRNPGGRADA